MSTFVVIIDRAQDVGDGVNDIRLYANPPVVRVSQQYIEILNSGDANKVRVSQQYLEILHSFGSLPPGNSGTAPGHNKPPPAQVKWFAFVEREQKHRNQRTGRFSNPDAVIYSMDYLPLNEIPIRQTDVVKTVRIG